MIIINNYIWIFGENQGLTANNNSYYLWKYAVNIKDDIEKYTLQLIGYGSSSGTETCAGILNGYNFIKEKELIKWL